MIRTCKVCGTEFPYGGKRSRRKFCSATCRKRADHAREWDREPNPPVMEDRLCACGMTFSPTRITQRYCTRPCRARLFAHLRRSGITRQRLWYRDHGTCVLCGRLVDLSIAWPDEGTATIEHVLPLSRGGTNDPSNIGLAHWGCNLRKGSRTMQEWQAAR